jgi:hypothetical protein
MADVESWYTRGASAPRLKQKEAARPLDARRLSSPWYCGGDAAKPKPSWGRWTDFMSISRRRAWT